MGLKQKIDLVNSLPYTLKPQMPTLAISDEVRVCTIIYTEALILLKTLPEDDETDYIKIHLYEYGIKHTEKRPLIVTPEYYDIIYKTLYI